VTTPAVTENPFAVVRRRLVEARAENRPFEWAWADVVADLRPDDQMALWSTAGAWYRGYRRLAVSAAEWRVRKLVSCVEDADIPED
jgi:hypothetical protein